MKMNLLLSRIFKKCIKLLLYGTFVSLLFAGGVYAQEFTVSGKVTSQDDGSPIPGVNVIIKGTSQGTATDFQGKYSLTVPGPGTVLIFSYIGYVTVEEEVGNRTVIDVSMATDVTQLGEVVVTAFGIEKEKKAITYAAQNVETQEITAARPLNIMEGLSGKVAGLSVTRAGTGVGSAAKVVLRGNRSIAGSSQPLYVIDGVVVGGSIANLSPDDIESITVLKGANAAALYGSRANNGVIVVTTKKGTRGKDFGVTLNTSYMAASPIILTDFQNEYGQGNGGVYGEHANKSWGPKMDGSMKPHWSNDPNWPEPMTDYSPQPDNVKDFFRTGHNAAVNLGISTSSDNSNAYFSYTFTDAGGVVPSNDLTSHNLNVRYSANIAKKLILDSKVNYIRTLIDNQLATGENFTNPIRGAFRMPRNIKTKDAEIFEFIDDQGQLRQHYWVPGNNGNGNQYWTINRNLRENLNERVLGLISLKYNFTDYLSLLVRSAIDRSNWQNTTKYYNDTYIVADDGFYQLYMGNSYEWNSDFLLNFNKQFGEDWNVDASFGGNIRNNKTVWLRSNTDARKSPLNLPNLFSIANTAFVTAGEEYSRKQVQSLYGFATIGWKNAVFLDITGRNDWSSTLPKDNWSYFYPSVGLTVVLSDLLNTNPSFLSYLKVRGSYAKVGNDTSPYRSARLAIVDASKGKKGFMKFEKTIPANSLRPESTTSTEIGLDAKFFNNRLGIDFTWYKSNSTDQLFRVSVPIGSGASNIFINAGNIENKGVELVLNGVIIQGQKFNWDMTVNWSKNTSTVVEIAEGLDNLPLAGASFLGTMKLIEGNPWGDIYSRGFKRDDQGRVIVASDGTPMVTPGKDTKVSNFTPDWLGGIRNSFSYGAFDLSFLIDIRQGGTVSSLTNAILWGDGLTTATLQGRDGTLVFGENIFANETAVKEDGTPNDIQVDAETFWNKVGGRNAPVGEAFVIDASNSRLRELVFGYSIPRSALENTPIAGVRIAFVGRNLFFITNNSNYDPEIFVNTGNTEGWESFAPPTMREYGFNLKIDF